MTPKFAKGEHALLKIIQTIATDLKKYHGTVVKIIEFHGNVQTDQGPRDEGDWYCIEGEDGHVFYTREFTLTKLPNEHTPCDMEKFCKDFGYTLPPRRVKAAVSSKA